MSARDEFSCPCCGIPTDSSYCQKCQEAECGETDYRAESPCVAEMKSRGWKLFGDVHENATMRGSIRMCRVEVWRKPDGEVCFGRVLEVLS